MTAITRSPDHHYTFDGETYPGVTGILKVIDKSDALMAWASRMTAEAAVELGSGLVPLLEAVGRDGAVKALTARSGWQRDEAASLGSEVHRLADAHIRGEVLEIPDRAKAHVANYVEWWECSGWRVRASEALLVNPVVGYGGTLDLLCYDRDGSTVLADIKTGRAIYHEAVLQLAAYGMATHIETGALYPMPAVQRYVILHVTADGVREVEVHIGLGEQEAFLACVELARWRDSMKGKRL